MVYVTWNDTEDEEPNVISFATWEEAEEFCKENGLKYVKELEDGELR